MDIEILLRAKGVLKIRINFILGFYLVYEDFAAGMGKDYPATVMMQSLLVNSNTPNRVSLNGKTCCQILANLHALYARSIQTATITSDRKFHCDLEGRSSFASL
ncbi:MAG: hypothetical protein WC716_06855 [Chitinophagaceae bacterium]|jgi:hypothetical protein